MAKLDVHEAKTHLSEWLDRLEEEVWAMTIVTPDAAIARYPVRTLW